MKKKAASLDKILKTLGKKPSNITKPLPPLQIEKQFIPGLLSFWAGHIKYLVASVGDPKVLDTPAGSEAAQHIRVLTHIGLTVALLDLDNAAETVPLRLRLIDAYYLPIGLDMREAILPYATGHDQTHTAWAVQSLSQLISTTPEYCKAREKLQPYMDAFRVVKESSSLSLWEILYDDLLMLANVLTSFSINYPDGGLPEKFLKDAMLAPSIDAFLAATEADGEMDGDLLEDTELTPTDVRNILRDAGMAPPPSETFPGLNPMDVGKILHEGGMVNAPSVAIADALGFMLNAGTLTPYLHFLAVDVYDFLLGEGAMTRKQLMLFLDPRSRDLTKVLALLEEKKFIVKQGDKYAATVSDGTSTPALRQCKVCGCTDFKSCPGGCFWVANDHCSKCAGVERKD